MKKIIFILLFFACNSSIPPISHGQVDSLIVKRDNAIPGRKSVIDQVNERITIKAFNNGVKATGETITFAIEAPANATGQSVVALASGVTDVAGKIKFDATMGDSLGIYTVHCFFGADILLSIPFDVISNEKYVKALVRSMEIKLDAIRHLIPNIALPASATVKFTDEDGEKQNSRKTTQTTGEASAILSEIDNIFESLERLAQKGKDLN